MATTRLTFEPGFSMGSMSQARKAPAQAPLPEFLYMVWFRNGLLYSSLSRIYWACFCYCTSRHVFQGGMDLVHIRCCTLGYGSDYGLRSLVRAWPSGWAHGSRSGVTSRIKQQICWFAMRTPQARARMVDIIWRRDEICEVGGRVFQYLSFSAFGKFHDPDRCGTWHIWCVVDRECRHTVCMENYGRCSLALSASMAVPCLLPLCNPSPDVQPF